MALETSEEKTRRRWNLSVQTVHISNRALEQPEVISDLWHLLPQSEAFQGDILPHQNGGVWKLHFQVCRVFPDGTWEE